MTSPQALDLTNVRKQFPALQQDQVYFDNAGGTQCLGTVIDSISSYLSKNNVQMGATYGVGKRSTQKYEAGFEAGAKYINAKRDEIVIGASTTQLFRNLSFSLMPKMPSDAEIIISKFDHEANIASWVALATQLKLTVKWWQPAALPTNNPQQNVETLVPLLTGRTRLVTCTHTSNILGSIAPVRAIADAVHAANPHALLCVDGVAFAPHRPVDVRALGVDFYAFSWYKLYGPHVAQLYASRRAQDTAMTSLGHFFKSDYTLEDKLGLGGASYELMQSIPDVTSYLERTGWDSMVAHEVALQRVLLDYLKSKPSVYTVCGESEADREKRVAVISFKVMGRDSRELVETIEAKTPFGFRWGAFYSNRLVNEILQLDQSGVVRVSMVHYNTIVEIRTFVEALDQEVCGATR